MSVSFNPHARLIFVTSELEGPSGAVTLRLALDTGATRSLINVAMLVAVGYDPALAPNRVQVTTASGIEFVPRVQVTRFSALGQDRLGFQVLGHTLPPSTGVDGLIGLDFLRGLALTIDFRSGRLTLA